MAQMTADKLATIVRQEIDQSMGYDSDELSDNREQALRYYYGEARGDEIPGRSQVQSLDVADMVEAVTAQIMPAFEIDNPVMFEAESADDVDQAQLESDAVNFQIMERNRGYSVFQEAVRDALLLRNGWCKVWVDVREDVEYQSFQGLDPIAAYEIASTETTPELKVEIADQEQQDDGTIDLRVKIIRTTRKLRITSIDPTLMLWSEGHDSIFLDGIRFVAEQSYPTRSELIEQGYSKKTVKALPVTTLDTKNDTTARNRGESWEGFAAKTPDQEVVTMYECYILVDYDGDGVSERRRVKIVDTTILENEVVDFIPYATGTPFLQPHRINGLSLFDKLKQVQDVKTATLRNYLDNMAANNNARMAFRKGSVNLNHLTNSRPGGAIECMDPQSDLVPIPVIDTGASNIQLLEYQDKMRSERGGASLDLQNAEMQIAGDTAHGVERQYSSREQLAALMCRTLAETLVRSVYMKTHTAMRLLMPGDMQFQQNGEFVSTDPNQWPERDRLNIKSGLSVGERQRKVAALGNIINEHKQLAQMGQAGIMFTANNAYAAYQDMTRAGGLDTPERYWQNPASEPAQQAAQAAAQQQQQAAAQQQDQQNQILAVQKAIEDQKAAVDMFQSRLDAMIEVLKISADMETKEAELVGKAALELEKTALSVVNNEATNDK